MAFEIELKFLGADFSMLRNTLRLSGGVCKGWHLERNVVFDTPQRTFKQQSMLLRLRSKRWADREEVVVTLKRPPAATCCDPLPDDVKIYDEQETVVACFDSMQGIFEGLGYAPAFRYDKMREEWQLDNAEICLDSLPFGDVVEIEAGREEILNTAKKIGLDMALSHTGTYHDLHREYLDKQGLPPADDFVFTEDRLSEIMTNMCCASTAR